MKNKLISKIIASFLVTSMIVTSAPLSTGTILFAEGTNKETDAPIYTLKKERDLDSDIFFEKWYDEDGNELVPELTPNYGDRSVIFPEKYDLRDYNRVPDKIRFQGNTGTCWAHAGMCSAETNMITKGMCGTDIDLSEAHLSYFTQCKYSEDTNDVFYHLGDNEGTAKGYDSGGNPGMVAAALARGTGPVNDAEENYVTKRPTLDEKARYDSVAVLKNYEEYSPSDREAMKSAIMNKGAITLGMKINPSDRRKALYYTANDRGGGHEVAVIGWDDNYSKENFNSDPQKQPPEDGAWLCRNSWGESVHDKGYFWLSYNNSSMYLISSFEMEKKNFDQIYQYDYENQLLFQPGQNTRGTVIGNVYTADSDEALNAVGFYTYGTDNPYTIIIRSDVEKGKPTSGKELLVQTGSERYSGYHKIDLSKQIHIEKGSNFSVSVMFSKGNAIGYAYSNPNLKDSDSFFGHFFLDDPNLESSKTTWRKNSGSMVACVKAFSNNGVPLSPDYFPDSEFRRYLSDIADTDNNNVLSDSERAAVTEINPKGYSIYSLKGIECFTELKKLNISGQHIVALDLSQNKKLTKENVNSYMCYRVYEDEIKCSLLNELDIDSTKLSNMTNIFVENGIIAPSTREPEKISYRYDCGNDISVFIQIELHKGISHNTHYSYPTRGAVNPDYHWETCADCRNSFLDEHVFEDYTSEDGEFKTKRCTLCGWITPISSHFDGDHDDESCPVCLHINGGTSAHSYGEYKAYSSYNVEPCHYRECFICGQKEYSEHEFGEYTDNGNGTHSATCATCGYVLTAEHDLNKPVYNDSNSHKLTCKSCSYTKNEAHHWVASKTLRANDTNHYKECADKCGNYVFSGAHTIEYVETGDGKHTHVCSFCGKTLWEEHYYCYINGALKCSDEPIKIDDIDDKQNDAATPFVFGDVTNDGRINVSDILMFRKYFFGTAKLGAKKNADNNKDEAVNIYDYIMFKNQILNNQ